MDASASKSGDAAVVASEVERASSSCSEFVTAQIELSKLHWSELSGPIPDGMSAEDVAVAKLDNQKVFAKWESHSEWGAFFFTFGHDSEIWKSAGLMKVGEKFAEGAQAEIFHVRVEWRDIEQNKHDLMKGVEYVLKVFKKGTLVQDLQHQWPDGLFHDKAEGWERHRLGKPPRDRFICGVECATLLEDGRFAFLMVKEDGDLHSLIDRKMMEGEDGCGPFSKEVGEEIMYRVARGMDELHSYNIIHRDLKASNVLVDPSSCGKYLWCSVADYECSIGVVGTGFWRAPEILRACKERNVGKRPELFSREADMYSFGMTCYEVLTGRVPFQDHPLSDQNSLLTDLVIDQHLRPEVPEYVDDWVLKLLHCCWQAEPHDRPSFKDILSFLEANSNLEYIKGEVLKRIRDAMIWGSEVHSRIH